MESLPENRYVHFNTQHTKISPCRLNWGGGISCTVNSNMVLGFMNQQLMVYGQTAPQILKRDANDIPAEAMMRQTQATDFIT